MIRDATRDDLERLRAVQTSLPEPNPVLLAYALDGPPLVLASTRGGEPVGYALVVYDDRVGYLAELAVDPAHRREGRASRLLVETFARLRANDCSRVTLTVHPDNEAARRLYANAGFRETGREADYYADGSDAVVMERTLCGRH